MKNDYGGSHTPKEIKDLWQTPKPVLGKVRISGEILLG